MLYVSTRNEAETFTAHVALTNNYAVDGGSIVPFRLPVFEADEISGLKNKPFNQILADILNQFFSARFTLWDVDLSVGKSRIRTLSMSHRLMVAELWHNPAGDFSYITERLRNRLTQEPLTESSAWLKMAVWIAAFFGVYGQMITDGLLEEGAHFDVVVPSDDLMMPVAAHNARIMGLPIRMVICSCSGENNLWDLVHRGTVNTSALDAVTISGIESLLYTVLGSGAVMSFLDCCEKKRIYSLDPLQHEVFQKGFYCTVAGESRADATINSFFRSNGYLVDPTAAICYSGLQDYRAGTGSSCMTLLMTEHTPLDFQEQICRATGIPRNKLFEYVKF